MLLTREERALIARLRTPRQVQRWLDSLPYNKGNVGKTLRSFRGVVEHKTAHCMEGALAAAFILGRHGHPPLLLDLSSSDKLDHVCFLFSEGPGRGQGRGPGGQGAGARKISHPAARPGPGPGPGPGPRRWGTVSQSRYPGLRGRAPVYRSVRDLAWSYAEPFVDATGAVRGYATFDLRDLGGMDWALDRTHVWRIEKALLQNRHQPLRLAPRRERELRARYLAWTAEHPDEFPPRAFYPRPAHFW